MQKIWLHLLFQVRISRLCKHEKESIKKFACLTKHISGWLENAHSLEHAATNTAFQHHM